MFIHVFKGSEIISSQSDKVLDPRSTRQWASVPDETDTHLSEFITPLLCFKHFYFGKDYWFCYLDYFDPLCGCFRC